MEKEKKVVEGNNANPEPAGQEPVDQGQAPHPGQMPKEAPKPDKGKDKKKAIIALLCIAIAAVVAGGIFLISSAHINKQQEQERLSIVQTDVFLPGVTIGGIDVSGMTMEQVAHIQQIINDIRRP